MNKKQSRVIIADTDKDNGDMLSQILRLKGCNVKVTSNAEVFNNALNDHPDFIFIHEPTSEFIELLREKPKDKLPKLFLISRERYTEQEKRILADKFNTVEILRLPFDIDEFEKKISCYI